MNNVPTPIRDQIETLLKFREAFSNITVMRHDKLPENTIIVSSDVLELLHQLENK